WPPPRNCPALVAVLRLLQAALFACLIGPVILACQDILSTFVVKVTGSSDQRASVPFRFPDWSGPYESDPHRNLLSPTALRAGPRPTYYAVMSHNLFPT
ncbi:hypothetical protein EMPG_17527, partial [Blastomyces silverae]